MTNEKMLTFAYNMRKMCEKHLTEKEGYKFPYDDEKKLNGIREACANLFPEYLEIHTVVNQLEKEIMFDTAKKNGKKNEKTRTKIAKDILNYNTSRPELNGYKEVENERIMITNGLVCYLGEPILDIPKSEFPDSYPNLEKLFDENREVEYELDFENIKAKYKMAKAEYKEEIKAKKHLKLYEIAKYTAGCEMFVGKNESKHWFNSEFIIQACELIAATSYTIQLGKSETSPAVIIGDNGNKCLICPFRKK